MPKDQFFKLKISKREKIILAARAEFSSHKYDDVSINDIVERSDISRGSFYLYFEDKWDIYSHLLKCTFENIRARMKDTLERGNNIFFTLLDVYDYIVLESPSHENVGFIANILDDITPSAYNKIYNILSLNEDTNYLKQYCFNRDSFTIQTDFEFEILKKHLILILSEHLTKALVIKEDPNRVRDELRVAYNILKYVSFK